MRTATRATSSEQSATKIAVRIAAGLTLGLGGCAQFDRAIEPPPVNPSSPIASYAEEVSRQPLATPDFSQIPPKPTDVRSAKAYKAAVMDEVGKRRELAAWHAAHPDIASDVEGWADLQRHRIPASAAARVAPNQDAESAAFARRLREEAAKSSPQQ